MLLDSLRSKLNVTWKWVEGHGTSEGNIEADKLAGLGVEEPSCYWQKRAPYPDLESVALPTKSNAAREKPAENGICSTPKEEEKQMCSFCNNDYPGKKIQCSDCKSMCHYLCTRLPRYQLYALYNTHRKYSCEMCLKIPESFANDIEDEVSLRLTEPPEKPVLDESPEVSEENRRSFDEIMSKNNTLMREMLQKFQSTTVHVLESSFIDAIEQLGSTKVNSKDNDQLSQIEQLLQEKDKLIREKENLLKSVKTARTEAVNSASNQHTDAMQSELQCLTKERDDLRLTLHKTTTELKVRKLKLQTETSVWRQKRDAMSSRNDILENESMRLEKMLSLKNEDISELENSKRELKRQIESLQSDVLSWKLHASRADDALLQAETPEALETSVVILEDKNDSAGKVSYSAILTSEATKDKNNNTRPPMERTNPPSNTDKKDKPSYRIKQQQQQQQEQQ